MAQAALDVTDYGAVGDNVTDDTAAINAAIAAAVASGAGRIYFPAGIYVISSQITITVPLFLAGDGPSKSIIRQTSGSAGGIAFSITSTVPVSHQQGGGISGLAIEAGAGWMAGGFTGRGSTGTGLYLFNSVGMFLADNFSVANFANGVKVAQSYYHSFRDFQILHADANGLWLGDSTSLVGGGFFSTGKISNFGYTGPGVTTAGGIIIQSSGGDHLSHIDVTSFGGGVTIAPPAGKWVTFCFFDSVEADTSYTNGWNIDGTNGTVQSLAFENCWAGQNTNGSGVLIKGSGVNTLLWSGARIRENGVHGVNIQGGANVEFANSEISSNSKLSNNARAGVRIEPGVSEWGITGCRIGNFGSSGNGQSDSIEIAAGASANFRIIGNDLRGFGAGKMAIRNGATGSGVIANNL